MVSELHRRQVERLSLVGGNPDSRLTSINGLANGRAVDDIHQSSTQNDGRCAQFALDVVENVYIIHRTLRSRRVPELERTPAAVRRTAFCL